MALEHIGDNQKLKLLIKKLEEKYPHYDFSTPAPLDRICKAKHECNKPDKLMYYDVKGNLYCGQKFQQTIDETNINRWEWRTCNALVKTVEELKLSRAKQNKVFN